MRDVHQLMNVAPIESDDIVFRMDGDAIAIRVRERRRDHRPHGWLCDATDPPHRLLYLSRLQFELMRIADVLIAAPAASTEVRTFGRDALRRSLPHFDQFAFGKLLFLPRDFCRDALALDREWNKDRFAFIARDAFAAEG